MALSVIFMFVSAFICLVLPTLIAVVMMVKRKGKLKSFVLGIIVFSMSQLLIRIPLLGLLQNTVWFNMLSVTNIVLVSVFAAVTAGLFEECGRFFGIKLYLSKDELTWNDAFVFGLGHGGVEAFALAGIPFIDLIAKTLSGENAAAILNIPAATFLMGGAERALAVILHIGFSMLVFYAVRYRKLLYLLYAVAAHTLVDTALPPVLNSIGINLSGWELEGLLAVFAALSVLIIVKMRAALAPAPENGGVLK